MITKITTPIVKKFNGNGDLEVVGTKVEYRLLGILLYRKILYLPQHYGVSNYDDYYTRI